MVDSHALRNRLSLIIAGITILIISAACFLVFGRKFWVPLYISIVGEQTVEDVKCDAGPRVEASLMRAFDAAGVDYPGDRLTFLAFKEEKRLELWVRKDDSWVFVKDYPVLAASGSIGPKLTEGDRQVPEGIYGVEYLNPNSNFHLSIKLDYPNAFDRDHARADGRTKLGGDIFIHGNSLSVGCLAMGDPGSEELFILTSLVGRENVRIIISPSDTRKTGPQKVRSGDPPWLPELYHQISDALKEYPR